jgi:hypothetical protein
MKDLMLHVGKYAVLIVVPFVLGVITSSNWQCGGGETVRDTVIIDTTIVMRDTIRDTVRVPIPAKYLRAADSLIAVAVEKDSLTELVARLLMPKELFVEMKEPELEYIHIFHFPPNEWIYDVGVVKHREIQTIKIPTPVFTWPETAWWKEILTGTGMAAAGYGIGAKDWKWGLAGAALVTIRITI